MQSILGIAVFVGLAWAASERRNAVAWPTVGVLLGAQLAISLVLFHVPVIRDLLLVANVVVRVIEQATSAGASFVFGYLGGGETPFAVTRESARYVFAFRVLPQVLVFSVLVAVLWYLRLLPLVVGAFARVLRRVAGVSGATGLAAASSVILGMVESPLVIRAYLGGLSRSELFVVMTCGMATVAGSIMVLYASVLAEVVPGSLGHIVVASVINVLGALLIAGIMVPAETHASDAGLNADLRYASLMDAIMRGTQDGIRLVVNVAAMLIVLVSLVALVDLALSGLTVADHPLSLARITGWCFAPVAWLIGIPWAEAQTAGGLLGTKLILNELVAYVQLAGLPPDALSAPSRLVMTYALCGFANFGSLGIMLGGLTTLVTERREELLRLAPKTLVSGMLTNAITGAIVALMTTL